MSWLKPCIQLATEELLSTWVAESGTSLAGRLEVLAEAVSCTDVLAIVCRLQQVVLFQLVYDEVSHYGIFSLRPQAFPSHET